MPNTTRQPRQPAYGLNSRYTLSLGALIAASTFGALPNFTFAATQAQTAEELRNLEKKGDSVPAPAEVDAVPDKPVPPRKPASDAQKVPAAAATTTFTASEIRFSPSAVFNVDELETFAEKFLNTPITITDLHRLTATLNTEYAKRGYPINIANVPPQKIKDGIVQIQLIEARVGEVRVENNELLSTSYVLDHLDVPAGTPIQIERLEKRFVTFNKTNRASVVAELKAGKEIGTTDVVARITEPPVAEVLAYVDNAGRENTGLYRRTGMVRGYSWLTSGDSTAVAAVLSEGTLTAFGSYEVPIGPYGAILGGSYAYGETSVIKGPFEDLDITGISHSGNVHLSHPLYTSNTFSLKAIVTGTYYHSTTDFVEVLTDKEEVAGGTGGLEAEYRDNSGQWTLNGEFRGGKATLGSNNAVPDPRNGEFYKLSGNISRVQRVTDYLSLFAVAGGQFSLTKRLASSEQFQLGGTSTVRGFPENAIQADHGYFARGEAWLNLPRSDDSSTYGFLSRTFSFFAFVDHGGSFPYKGHDTDIAEKDFLTSWGLGLAFNYRDIITAQFTYADPLSGIPGGKREQPFLFRVGVHVRW